MRRRQQNVLATTRAGRVWILVNPLVVRVVVDAEQIEILRTSTEFWTESATDHVKRLELRHPVTLRGSGFLGIVRIDGDVNDRLGVTDARAWIHFAHGFDRGDRRAHELRFQLGSALLRERIQEAGVTAAPRYERDLVNWCDVNRSACLCEHDFGGGASEACEALDEGGAPDV